jgi:hypothetical protein
MSRHIAGGLVGLAVTTALLIAGPAIAEVQVRYAAPERFTDAENRFGSGPPLPATLSELTRIFQDLGNARLRQGGRLDITVRDIDLAGFDRPGFAAPTGVRVVTDATPPRIRLAYTLRRGGRTIAQGEDTVTDINFLLTSNPRFSTGGLSYERQILRDWFARRFPESPDRG